jgi:toxin ParE1/3/4
MSRRIDIRPDAFEDMWDQYRFIAKDNPDAAVRFLEAADSTCEQLASMPSMGRRPEFRHSSNSDVRQWRVNGFEKCLIFYEYTDDVLTILRVLHSARNIAKIIASEFE